MIKIGIKGLAKFMTSGAAAQRKAVRDYKYPDPEGQAQAKYYRDVRRMIVKFHDDSLDSLWLEAQAAALMASVQSAKNIQTVARLKNNARALKRYADNFGNTKYEILEELNLVLTFSNVQVIVSPDLHVREGGMEKLLKLEFAEKVPDKETIKIITQGMFEAALANSLNFPSSQILYVDVPRGMRYKGARLGARMRANIEAACQTIAAIWPTI